MDFKEFNLHESILKAIEEAGYTSPTPIQEQAIPQIMKGSDLRASAQTGTGKTAAFILPCLNRLATPSTLSGKGPRVLILVPTRELAMQVATEAAKYSKHLPRAKVVCVYGGAPYPPQLRELAKPYEILVATPGRLIDHMERGKIDFSRTEILILDEADRMLDMGFIKPVEQISDAMPKPRQTLMFSATLAGSVLKLSNRLLRDPVEIKISPERVNCENVEQRLHRVDHIEHKYRLLNHLLDDPTISQTIIFTATKRQADHLVDKLCELGREARALHGDMNQRQRTRTLKGMRDEEFNILVATDVAARGIDIQTITHVINFDLPRNPEDYVHRIGRTGRAGASGIALSFAASRDMPLVKQIERFTGQRIDFHTVAGMEPSSKSESGYSRKPSYGDRESRPRREYGGGGESRPKREYGFGRKKPQGGEFSPRQEPSFSKKRSFDGDAPRESSFPRKKSFDNESPREPSFYKKKAFGGESSNESSYPRKRSFDNESPRESSFPRKRSFDNEAPRESSFPRKKSFDGDAPREPSFAKKKSFGGEPTFFKKKNWKGKPNQAKAPKKRWFP
ncbi:MAG: DEAD/DEAH box helicase [Candidatus Melainabacteria bacterium]|nr:DEAD/DEAH box helicase [Candidatus Melainabacteria bacterium]